MMPTRALTGTGAKAVITFWCLSFLNAGGPSTCSAQIAQNPFVEAIDSARAWIVKIQARDERTGSGEAGDFPWSDLVVVLPSVAVHESKAVSEEAARAAKAWQALQQPTTCEFVETPLRKVVGVIARECGLSFLVAPNTDDALVTAACDGAPAHEALRTVCGGGRRDFKLRGAILVVAEAVEPERDEMLADVVSCATAGQVADVLAASHDLDVRDSSPVEAFVKVQEKLGVEVRLTAAAKANGNTVTLKTGTVPGRELLRRVVLSFELDMVLHKGSIVVYDPAQEGRRGEAGSATHGTGVVFDSAGYILTAAKTLRGCRTAIVHLPDGARVEGVVVGADERRDIAVLKVQHGDLAVAEFGDSEALKMGQFVATLAYPFDSPRPMASLGIVSATDRRVNRIYRCAIVTDAAIFPGSAGGVLLDEGGRVVGMIAALYSSSEGSKGLGCCIPSNILQGTADALKYRLPIKDNWVGMTLRDVGTQNQPDPKIGAAKGAVVVAVAQGGPAEKAGLAPRDVIVACDGKSVADVEALAIIVEKAKPGQALEIQFVRRGKSESGTLEVGSRED